MFKCGFYIASRGQFYFHYDVTLKSTVERTTNKRAVAVSQIDFDLKQWKLRGFQKVLAEPSIEKAKHFLALKAKAPYLSDSDNVAMKVREQHLFTVSLKGILSFTIPITRITYRQI